MFENIAVIDRARATVYAYDCSPSVCAFEALAFGLWWVELGLAKYGDPSGAVFRAFNCDDRFFEIRRELGSRQIPPLDWDWDYREVERCRALLNALPSVSVS
ncbi:hypothetical protein AB0E01_23000 [Nocardia vinacea]|uniref:hypothetical protein n=1 Tax=Nocardia vinacea TaxID=96468 RepID=UPI00340F1671